MGGKAKSREEWEMISNKASKLILGGMSKDQAFREVGVSGNGYWSAAHRLGLPKLPKSSRKWGRGGSRTSRTGPNGNFVSFAPVGEGGIKITIGKLQFTIGAGDVEALKTIIAATSGENN